VKGEKKMDQIKIGEFIQERRKAVGLTQMQLAQMLNITDRAVSKWETGRSLPDSSIMLELSQILKISVNDLLNGEVIDMNDYNEKNEQLLLELAKEKEDSHRRLLFTEIIIATLSTAILLALTFTAAYVEMSTTLRVILIVIGFVQLLICLPIALKIEQVAGYYECGKCHHRYVPTFLSVFFAMHAGRTRYMKCPECHKWSWNKKVLTKK
jgi:transcriptional regulator with XRE-family HTH domain